MKLKNTKYYYILYRSEIGAIISTSILILVSYFLENAVLTLDSLIIILTLFAELGVPTVGVAFLMISGEFDLSIGAIFALTPILTILLSSAGIDITLSVIFSLLIASIIGYVNSLLTLKLKIPSFIATLGVMFTIRGLLLVVTGGFPLEYEGGYHPLLYLLGGRLSTVWGMRASSIWALVIIFLLAVVLDLTPYGNHVYASGGNPTVAQELGINTNKVKKINFIISGSLAGIAGLFTLERLKSGDPLYGFGLELNAIAAAVVGGCSLTGGYGSIIGAALGALAIAVLRTSFVLLGIPPYWYEAFIGIILVFAALLNKYISDFVLKHR